jgi:hypothetical protein
MAERGSRWQSSVLTFGPLGRLAATAFVGLILVWFLVYGGLWGIPGIIIWGGYFMPRALRDIWRPAALPSTDLTRLRDEASLEAELKNRPERTHLALDPEEPPPPTRW